MDPLHERATRIGLAAIERYGFALAGCYAIQAHGFLNRVSEDVDLFAVNQAREQGYVQGRLCEDLGGIVTEDDEPAAYPRVRSSRAAVIPATDSPTITIRSGLAITSAEGWPRGTP